MRREHQITIRKDQRATARLLPAKPKPSNKPVIPDFMARLKEIYGEHVSKVTMAETVAEDRDHS